MIDTRKLKRQMTTHFLSGVSFAKKIGISRQALYVILRGDGQPSPETFAKMCEILDCEPEELLEDF